MIQAPDTLVLRGFQSFADWFERKTDKTCFFLARIFALLTVGTILLQAYCSTLVKRPVLFGKELITPPIGIVSIIMAFILLVYAVWIGKRREKEPRPDVGALTRAVRFICILATIIIASGLPANLITFLFAACATPFIFFDDCKPLSREDDDAAT